jgi:chromosome segregation ATPase
MSTVTQVVNLIEEKLNSLLENYTFLKEENELLYSKITTLEHQIAKDEQLFNEIEKKYQTLKIAKTLEGSKEDRRETKLKINASIREVDACISQLSE